MIPAAFDYTRATSIDDALAIMAGNDGAKVIAGGQSILPALKLRLTEVDRLIDIGSLEELLGISVVGTAVRIGSATTYRDLLDSEQLQTSHPLIGEVTGHIADVQVRNRGTIGGGLAHADPSSDMPAAMLALNATFVLQSRSGTRNVAAREFFEGPFTTAMRSGELLVAIELPPLPSGAGTAYASFEQAASGYPMAGAAAVVAVSNGKVSHADLAFTGIADMPFLAAAAKDLVGTNGDADAIDKVAARCVDGVDANEDIHASAEYRLHLGVVAAKRAFAAAIERAG